MESDFIAKVVIDLNLASVIDVRSESILSALLECAKRCLPGLIQHTLEHSSARLISRAVSANSSQETGFQVSQLRDALIASQERIDDLLQGELSEKSLLNAQKEREDELLSDLKSGKWISTFRGRDILKSFLHQQMNGIVRYEVFRDLIISKMRDSEFQPAPMASVIAKIEGDA